MIIFLYILSAMLFTFTIYLVYINRKLNKSVNNKYLMDKFIIDNYTKVHDIKIYIWSTTFNNVISSRLYSMKFSNKTLNDKDIQDLAKKFLERCISLFGSEMIEMIIRISYYGDSDSYLTDALRYFHESLYNDETYKKINGHNN